MFQLMTQAEGIISSFHDAFHEPGSHRFIGWVIISAEPCYQLVLMKSRSATNIILNASLQSNTSFIIREFEEESQSTVEHINTQNRGEAIDFTNTVVVYRYGDNCYMPLELIGLLVESDEHKLEVDNASIRIISESDTTTKAMVINLKH